MFMFHIVSNRLALVKNTGHSTPRTHIIRILKVLFKSKAPYIYLVQGLKVQGSALRLCALESR